MAVKWSREANCYTWSCLWGCSAYDFESAEEAEDDFLWHDCGKAVL
jgi:hypothetical protein